MTPLPSSAASPPLDALADAVADKVARRLDRP
jgi:hypothetical protein